MNDNVEKIDLNRVDWKSSREFFESLGEALNKLEDKDESYDFTWVGKRKSIIEAGAPIDKILRPDVEASKDFDNTKNMLIVGDNLDALKLLQESYLGKIKMIYIDPPYNTGHDFVYHDNFTVKKADFEDDSTDSDGNVIISEDEYAENSKANGRFHSDWLSMMYPRLKLARNLLTDDGMIFISIDSNEAHNLKKLCDEIFGEENFIADIAWRRFNSQANVGIFSKVRDSILFYAKNNISVNIGRLPLSETAKKEYQYKDENGIYARRPCIHSVRGHYVFDYTTPNGNIIRDHWMMKEEDFLDANARGLIHWPANGGNPMRKMYLKDALKNGQIANDFWGSEFGNNRNATEEIKNMFDDIRVFDFPKPTKLLKNLINIGSVSDEEYILDFFAGSGATGHAAMDLNAEDGGKRQYICVQLDEKTDEKSEARKAGYDTIDQITAERLRRAGEKIKSEHPEADIDTGFRVFRVDGSNNNENIRKPLGEIDQSDMFDMIDNVKKDRTPLDLLFGVIYTSALPFDLKLETRKIGENTVYMYGYLDENTGLIACFDDEIPEETVKEIAKLNPLTAAFKDSSFKDSAEKINLSEHFRIISPDTRVKVI